jgi:CheY-like chemotaxis protein
MASPRVVLCVDGEPEILLGYRFVLSIAGYEVVPASSAEEALQFLTDLSVDIVVVNQALPDLPGTRLSQEMKRIKPHVPIVLITQSPERPPDGSNFVDLLVSRDSYPTEFLSALGRIVPFQPAVEPTASTSRAGWGRAI